MRYNFDVETSSRYDEEKNYSYITSARVTRVNVNNELMDELWHKYNKKKPTAIQLYAVDRIFRAMKLYDTSKWEAIISDDYYGQHFDGAEIADSRVAMSLREAITALAELDERGCVEKALTVEYGFIPDRYRDALKKSVAVKTVQVKELVNSNDHQTMIKRDDTDYDLCEGYPIGVYVRDNDSYRVVDGNHRLRKFLNEPERKVKILVIGD